MIFYLLFSCIRCRYFITRSLSSFSRFCLASRSLFVFFHSLLMFYHLFSFFFFLLLLSCVSLSLPDLFCYVLLRQSKLKKLFSCQVQTLSYSNPFSTCYGGFHRRSTFNLKQSPCCYFQLLLPNVFPNATNKLAQSPNCNCPKQLSLD